MTLDLFRQLCLDYADKCLDIVYERRGVGQITIEVCDVLLQFMLDAVADVRAGQGAAEILKVVAERAQIRREFGDLCVDRCERWVQLRLVQNIGHVRFQDRLRVDDKRVNCGLQAAD